MEETELEMCNCEHDDHFAHNGQASIHHSHMAVPAGTTSFPWVGRVCNKCVKDHGISDL